MSGPSKYQKKDRTSEQEADEHAVAQSRIIKFPRLADYIEAGLKETIHEILMSNQPLDKMIDNILSEFARQEVVFAKYLTHRISEVMDEFNATTAVLERRRSPFDVKRFIKAEEALKLRVQKLEERLVTLETKDLSKAEFPRREDIGLTSPLTQNPELGGER